MTDAKMPPERPLILRNALGFAAMLAIYAAAVALVNQAEVAFDVRGIHRLTVPLAADALCGVVGYFVFAGRGAIRIWLVFFAALVLGASVALINGHGFAFQMLLSLPFAAVAAVGTAATDRVLAARRRPG